MVVLVGFNKLRRSPSIELRPNEPKYVDGVLGVGFANKRLLLEDGFNDEYEPWLYPRRCVGLGSDDDFCGDVAFYGEGWSGIVTRE